CCDMSVPIVANCDVRLIQVTGNGVICQRAVVVSHKQVDRCATVIGRQVGLLCQFSSVSFNCFFILTCDSEVISRHGNTRVVGFSSQLQVCIRHCTFARARDMCRVLRQHATF